MDGNLVSYPLIVGILRAEANGMITGAGTGIGLSIFVGFWEKFWVERMPVASNHPQAATMKVRKHPTVALTS